MNVVEKAVMFATEAHYGDVRKGTKTPYILHPMEAAVIAATMTDDKEIIAAALLHDVVEDAGVKLSEIRDVFGDRIAQLVSCETENKRHGMNPADTWEIRKRETIEHMKQETDVAVKIVALGDKLANIRSIYRDQTKIGDKVFDRFNVKDKAKHKWYYTAMADVTKELKETDAWKEYNALLKKVFE